MAEQTKKKLVEILSDAINDYGVGAGAKLNVGVHNTKNGPKNVQRAIDVLKESSDLSGVTHGQVIPDASDPKVPTFKFTDPSVQQAFDSGLISIPQEKQDTLAARFSESKGKPFSVAIKPENTSGFQIPMMKDAEIGSTLNQNVIPRDSWLPIPPEAEAWLRRPAQDFGPVGSDKLQFIKDVIGIPVSEGYARKLQEATTDKLGGWIDNRSGDVIQWTGDFTRKAAPLVYAGSHAKDYLFGSPKTDAEKTKKDQLIAAENTASESEFNALKGVFNNADTNDPQFMLGTGTIAGIPENLQDEVWRGVRKSVDANERTTSIYNLSAEEVMRKYGTAWDDMGKKSKWIRSTGRVDNKNVPVNEKIPESRTFSESKDARIIYPPFTLDPNDKKYGIKAKDGKRYTGVILDMGTGATKEIAKARTQAKKTADSLDPKKSEIGNAPKTLEQLMQEDESNPASNTERYKWVYFEVGDPSKRGMKSIYKKDGKIAQPEF